MRIEDHRLIGGLPATRDGARSFWLELLERSIALSDELPAAEYDVKRQRQVGTSLKPLATSR